MKKTRTTPDRKKQILFKPMKYWRKKRGFSQKEFAESINKPAAHVSEFETGKRSVTEVWITSICKSAEH
ncbi:MAG: hypothetical protein COA94_03260 [Rickettsiales bacterium]|nr:MAG: hypothetical protein COA94_03260 [Rickettsiales bacterium]